MVTMVVSTLLMLELSTLVTMVASTSLVMESSTFVTMIVSTLLIIIAKIGTLAVSSLVMLESSTLVDQSFDPGNNGSFHPSRPNDESFDSGQ